MDPEQTALGPHCLPYRLLKHFSRREKQTTFVVIGTLRVKTFLPCLASSNFHQKLLLLLITFANSLVQMESDLYHLTVCHFDLINFFVKDFF